MRNLVASLCIAISLAPTPALSEIEQGKITPEQREAFKYCRAFLKNFAGSRTLGDYADFFVIDKDGTFIDRELIKKNGRVLHEAPYAFDIERDPRNKVDFSILHFEDATEKSPDKTGIFFWDNSATNISTPGEPMGTKIDFEIRGGKCYPANVKSQDIKDFYTFVNMDDCLKTRAPDEIRKLIDTKTKENLLLAERLLNCKHVPLLEEMKQVFSPIENGTIRSETLRTVR